MHQHSKLENQLLGFQTVIYFDFFLALEKTMIKSNQLHHLFLNLPLIDQSSSSNNFPSLSKEYDVCKMA